jgi:hypothetical protein
MPFQPQWQQKEEALLLLEETLLRIPKSDVGMFEYASPSATPLSIFCVRSRLQVKGSVRVSGGFDQVDVEGWRLETFK